MKINKAIKIKIHPTIKQQKQLINHFGCARYIYNYFLDYKNKHYKLTKKSTTLNQTSKELTRLKKEPDKLWLNNVSRQCLANSLRNLDVAFNRFFTKKAEYPKFNNHLKYVRHSVI